MSGKDKTEQQNISRTEISTLGEFGLIKELTKDTVISNRSTVLGIGDDAAIIAPTSGCETVVSTDLLLEGLHFDLMYTPLPHLGFKAISVNVSDIYAMNAMPKQVTVSIGVSNRFSVEALQELYSGIHHACEHYGVDLIGGDTTSSKQGLVISVTAIGEAKPDDIVTRSGAKVGDAIYATGDYGAAYMGLNLLEREKQVFLENPEIQPELDGEKYAVGRLLKPYARKDVFELLDEMQIIPTAMIDVSDGLSSELFHICKSSAVGCKVQESAIPIHDDTSRIALDFRIPPITAALSGGEDYELLFTVDPKDEVKMQSAMYFTRIGEITLESDGYKLVSKQGNVYDLKAQGWTMEGTN